MLHLIQVFVYLTGVYGSARISLLNDSTASISDPGVVFSSLLWVITAPFKLASYHARAKSWAREQARDEERRLAQEVENAERVLAADAVGDIILELSKDIIFDGEHWHGGGTPEAKQRWLNAVTRACLKADIPIEYGTRTEATRPDESLTRTPPLLTRLCSSK